MHTKDKLANELENAGLKSMATKARRGYYHDFLSPLAFPEMQLAADLKLAGTPAALELLRRHMQGDFDASVEESEEWFQSQDGRDAMRQLTKHHR